MSSDIYVCSEVGGNLLVEITDNLNEKSINTRFDFKTSSKKNIIYVLKGAVQSKIPNCYLDLPSNIREIISTTRLKFRENQARKSPYYVVGDEYYLDAFLSKNTSTDIVLYLLGIKDDYVSSRDRSILISTITDFYTSGGFDDE